jgi:hypothetical protein
MSQKHLIGLLSLFPLFFALVSAQQDNTWRGSGGWGPGHDYARLYDATTIETVRGTVASIEEFSPIEGMSAGIGVGLTTDDQTRTILVHLGPSWFLQNQDFKIEEGDEITVTGSRVTFQNEPAIIASEVTKGEESLGLRDTDGNPLWTAVRSGPGGGGQGRDRQGGGAGRSQGDYNRLFDARTVEKVSGTVQSIERPSSRVGVAQGVHVLLEMNDANVLDVHLGPEWYLNDQDLRIEEGDKIEVTGSKVNFQGRLSLIASEVAKDGQTLVLRDAQGIPRWSASRRTE